jgi:hypothetical protein
MELGYQPTAVEAVKLVRGLDALRHQAPMSMCWRPQR